jgi:hypothetical protein
LAAAEIDHGDLIGIGHVREGLSRFRLDLKSGI